MKSMQSFCSTSLKLSIQPAVYSLSQMNLFHPAENLGLTAVFVIPMSQTPLSVMNLIFCVFFHIPLEGLIDGGINCDSDSKSKHQYGDFTKSWEIPAVQQVYSKVLPIRLFFCQRSLLSNTLKTPAKFQSHLLHTLDQLMHILHPPL